MAINSVSSSTSLAAQLLQQAQQATAKPEATETRASETRAEQRQDQGPEPTRQTQQAQPVVNTQGQVTGRVVNELA